jgi:hypothetical protein
MIPNCAGPIRQGVTGVEIITLVLHKVISLDWFAEDWVIWWVDCCGQKKRLVLVDQPKCRNRQYNQRRTS